MWTSTDGARTGMANLLFLQLKHKEHADVGVVIKIIGKSKTADKVKR